MPTDAASSDPAWRSRPHDELVWLELDGDFVAYHRPSGKTHLLNAASRALIRDILAEPRQLAAIADEFAPGDAGRHDEAYLAQMRAMLKRLEQLGLVERL